MFLYVASQKILIYNFILQIIYDEKVIWWVLHDFHDYLSESDISYLHTFS